MTRSRDDAAPPDPLLGLRDELDDLRTRGLHRELRALGGAQDAEVELDGRRVINFCSNNYLGLANHPALRRAAEETMRAEGIGAGASRLIGGNLPVHRALEADLAAWKHTESALLFCSGYQANVGLLSALAGPGDAIYSDQLNHASLIDGARLSRASIHVYPHNDMAALERAIQGGSSARRRLIVTESVFSMDGDLAPLDDLVRIAERHGAILIVDEAHATGVLGPGGVGLARRAGVHVQMGTLSKALGAAGAYVAAPAVIVDYLLNRARSFVFSTAPAVPAMAAARAALALLGNSEGAARRDRLFAARDRLHAGLVRLGLCDPAGAPSHIIPLIVRDDRRAMDLSAQLLARGFFIQGIRPPTVPQGSARLRISLSATHSADDIDHLVMAVKRQTVL